MGQRIVFAVFLYYTSENYPAKSKDKKCLLQTYAVTAFWLCTVAYQAHGHSGEYLLLVSWSLPGERCK